MSTGRDLNRVSSLIKLDMVIRGSYLGHVIPIEEIVKDIVAHHFCSEERRRLQLISLILHGRDFSFSLAIEILEKILTSYPEVQNKYPRIVKELDKIRRFRNDLAHSELDTSEEFLSKNLKETIRLKFYDKEGNTLYREITRGEVDERLNNCLETTRCIVDIRNTVRTLCSHR
jgi:hypothetical protein